MTEREFVYILRDKNTEAQLYFICKECDYGEMLDKIKGSADWMPEKQYELRSPDRPRCRSCRPRHD